MIETRTRTWTIRDDERLAQMDASAKYELYRVLSTLELRHLAGRRGHNVHGFGRQQIIATLIEKED